MADIVLFSLTDEHVTLLRRAVVRWEDCEYGAPAIDCKRPYGNSSVALDVAEILGWMPKGGHGLDDDLTDALRERADKIHAETETALQIILSTGSFETGTYRRVDYRRWERVA
jgi:hypothetical protein